MAELKLARQIAEQWLGKFAPELATEKLAARISERIEPLVKAAEAAKAHVDELADAWQRGAISEHDGLGGTRSNRNRDVEVKLRTELSKVRG